MAAINGLVQNQRKNSEGIAKLHESVQALLRSQEALRQQNIFNNNRKAKLEADLAALEQRNVQCFSELQDSVQGLKNDLNMISRLPSSPGTEKPEASRTAGNGDSLPSRSETRVPNCSIGSTNNFPVLEAPAPRAPDDDLRRLLALRGEAKLCNLPGKLPDNDGSAVNTSTNGYGYANGQSGPSQGMAVLRRRQDEGQSGSTRGLYAG